MPIFYNFCYKTVVYFKLCNVYLTIGELFYQIEVDF